ncbi:DNA glycosylase AlkZ-like family protein [Schaalia naturae]|uniref:DNA glycosylase AlkZ-like family protein n=1 Tax=Schaalia naturae TaxID=635203 RepID=A0ABW2SIL1_9ACTO
MSYTCSIDQARGLALAGAGLAASRPPRARSHAEARRRALAAVESLGYVQIDSVNVMARAQDMVLFSRIGAVPRDILTTPTPPGGDLVEHWAHEASVLTPAIARLTCVFPRSGLWGSRVRYREHADWEACRSRVLRLLSDQPATALTVADQIAPGDREGRRLAESCVRDAFASGELVGIGRTRTFQRLLARPELLWPDLWDRDAAPGPADAARELTRIALRGLGIARTSTVADWFRLPASVVQEALASLEAQGLARRVEVAGTSSRPDDPWWVPVPSALDEGAQPPRPRAPATAAGLLAEDSPWRGRTRLLSPFDPLVAHRPRLFDLFGVHYRIGIYTPAPKRTYGYYDLLVLRGADIVGRIDLRADRAAGVLRVMGFWLEPGPDRSPVGQARALRGELARVARWQGLSDIAVGDAARGNGAAALARVL